MATIRLSALVGQIAGSLGPITFSHRGAAIHVHRRKSRATPATVAMINQRNELSRKRALWDGLSDQFKTLWSIYASEHTRRDKIGQRRTMSAFLWFSWWVPWAEASLKAGVGPNYAPIAHAIHSGSPWPFTCDFSEAGSLVVETSITIYPAYDQMLRVWLGPMNAVDQPNPRCWIDLGFILATDPDVDITAAANAKGLYPRDGQYYAVRAAHIINGYWESEYSQTTVLTSA